MKIFAKRCSCGAITVSFDNNQWSMPENIFNKLFPDIPIEPDEFGCCDYCVNHWGLDLCGCGSGEKVGECENNFYECKNKIPSQILGEIKSYNLWN